MAPDLNQPLFRHNRDPPVACRADVQKQVPTPADEIGQHEHQFPVTTVIFSDSARLYP